MERPYDRLFLEGTIRITADVGIENLRTKAVADYAGKSEATLFRSFGTKEGVLEAAFLYVDRKLSAMLTHNAYVTGYNGMDAVSNADFEYVVYSIWCNFYRHLIDNPEETIFLIRYRYSSLYTKEVRAKRVAYSGGFDKIYTIAERKLGIPLNSYRGFLVNYIFEMTMCFAEKIIDKKISDSPETQRRIWAAICMAVKAVVSDTPAESMFDKNN